MSAPAPLHDVVNSYTNGDLITISNRTGRELCGACLSPFDVADALNMRIISRTNERQHDVFGGSMVDYMHTRCLNERHSAVSRLANTAPLTMSHNQPRINTRNDDEAHQKTNRKMRLLFMPPNIGLNKEQFVAHQSSYADKYHITQIGPPELAIHDQSFTVSAPLSLTPQMPLLRVSANDLSTGEIERLSSFVYACEAHSVEPTGIRDRERELFALKLNVPPHQFEVGGGPHKSPNARDDDDTKERYWFTRGLEKDGRPRYYIIGRLTAPLQSLAASSNVMSFANSVNKYANEFKSVGLIRFKAVVDLLIQSISSIVRLHPRNDNRLSESSIRCFPVSSLHCSDGRVHYAANAVVVLRGMSPLHDYSWWTIPRAGDKDDMPIMYKVNINKLMHNQDVGFAMPVVWKRNAFINTYSATKVGDTAVDCDAFVTRGVSVDVC